MIKKAILFLLCSSFVFIGWHCGSKKEKVFTQAEMEHYIDSIMKKKAVEMEEAAREELDYQMAIESKPKKDSLLNLKNEVSELPQIDTEGMNRIILPPDQIETPR